MTPPERVVMLSGGRTSWAAARRDADTHGIDGTVLLFADVKGEDPDLYRFLTDAANDIGAPLTTVADGRTIWDVFRDDRFLGNSRLANCSKLLKQKPCRDWMNTHAGPETVVVVGIGWDEQHRLPAIQAGWAPWRVEAPMCRPPYMDHAQIDAWMRSRGLRRPHLYDLGASHNNCGGGCVRAGQGQFAWLLEFMPDRFADWETNEQLLRDHLGKDVAILRDRTGGESRPMTLTELRERVESGGQLDLFDLGGCGCFVAEEQP